MLHGQEVLEIWGQEVHKFRRERSEASCLVIEIVNRVTPPNSAAAGQAIYLWKHGPYKFVATFSAKQTCQHIRTPRPHVNWSSGVWFKHATPK